MYGHLCAAPVPWNLVWAGGSGVGYALALAALAVAATLGGLMVRARLRALRARTAFTALERSKEVRPVAA